MADIAVKETLPRELTFRSVLLAVILTLLLAVSNSYLALKLGILASASIPAAIISMGILRFFKNASIQENNAVQTAASAGEAVAGGIVYTIPALVIIQYWQHFDYWTNFCIAASGGILGVLFSIPLRRILVHDHSLMFPEGRAIAEVLKTSTQRNGLWDIFTGGLIGGLLELLQTGFKVVAGSFSYWFEFKKTLFGFGAGFSATMIGAGYLVGHEMAISIFSGAVITWLFALPLLSRFFPDISLQNSPTDGVTFLWNSEMRYMGIGAMLFAGIWTFMKLIKPLAASMHLSLKACFSGQKSGNIPRTDKDIPMFFIFTGILILVLVLFKLFAAIFPLETVGLDGLYFSALITGAVLYVLVMGFLFSVITAYLSGMVGVTASPGSSVVIAGMLFAAWLLLTFINHILPLPLTNAQIQAAEAITIIVGSVVTGIAAIANDNSQDLKVGQLVGATPWKQQIMLLIGVLVSSLVIPPVMQLLFDVYGIAGIMPREGMDISQSLPAPTAALMAAITEAVFRHTLPWMMMLMGALVISTLIVLNKIFNWERFIGISFMGVAIGMYLPLASSVPLFLGGIFSLLNRLTMDKKQVGIEEKTLRSQTGILIACGLVAGSALMDVVLAIPFSIYHSPDAWNLVGKEGYIWPVAAGILSTAGLFVWIRKRVTG